MNNIITVESFKDEIDDEYNSDENEKNLNNDEQKKKIDIRLSENVNNKL